MSYIASNDNRLYAAAEGVLGQIPAVTAANRFAPVSFTVKQTTEAPKRRDKTGTRTFRGIPNGARRYTNWQLRSYLSSWLDQTTQPAMGPLFRAALGSAAQLWQGGTVASINGTTVTFASAHALTPGQAIAVNGELRFVSSVPSTSSVVINAPFSTGSMTNVAATPTITWVPGRSLTTASIFDYWSPAEAIQRVISGAAVDEFQVKVNGDYHEFAFSGPARDVIDLDSFADGQGGLSSFPIEPDLLPFDAAILPGHLGQVWLGAIAERFYTLSSATIRLSNDLESRCREFGLEGMRTVVPGQRKVEVDFDLFATTDDATRDLHTAAQQRSPMQIMFQLGEQTQQLFGVYLKSFVPQLPEYDDSDNRLAWKFKNCRAQGTDEDEISVAFG